MLAVVLIMLFCHLVTGAAGQFQEVHLSFCPSGQLVRSSLVYVFSILLLIIIRRRRIKIIRIKIIIIEPTAPKEKATGEKRPATALELGTYALSRSFSHASHGDRSRSSVPHRSYVPVTGGRYPATLKTCASRLVLCAV